MNKTAEIGSDALAACLAALQEYRRSLHTALLRAGAAERFSSETLWEEICILEFPWGGSDDEVQLPTLACELSGLVLYGSHIEWRGRSEEVPVPDGYRAVPITAHLLELIPSETVRAWEPDGLLGPHTTHIRQLNDSLRRTFHGGKVVLTPGVQQSPVRTEVLRAVMDQDPEERPGDDPSGRHQFGMVVVGGVRFFWKIDYYARISSMRMSLDLADPAVTARVLTILRADEW